jgi:hypothetical protein
MQTTRRTMIRTTALAVAGASALPALAAAGQQPLGERRMPAVRIFDGEGALSRLAFVEQLDENFFALRSGGVRAAELKLIAVKDPANAVALGMVNSSTCFTVVFSAYTTEGLVEGTYPVQTPRWGRIDLYLRPTVTVGESTWYEAAFNRPAFIN